MTFAERGLLRFSFFNVFFGGFRSPSSSELEVESESESESGSESESESLDPLSLLSDEDRTISFSEESPKKAFDDFTRCRQPMHTRSFPFKHDWWLCTTCRSASAKIAL